MMTKTISVGLIGSEEDVAVKAGAAGPFALTVLKKDEYQVTDFGSVVELAAAYRAEGIAFKWAGPVERGFTREEQAEFDDLVVIDEEVRQ